MVDWNLIPLLGDKGTRKRLREIDRELVSILVVISIGFSKIFEGLVGILISEFPVILFGIDFSAAFWWTVYTLGWIVLFILEADKMVKEGAESVKEAVEE